MIPPAGDTPGLFLLFLLSFLSEILIPIPITLILIAMVVAGFAAGPVVVVSMIGFTLGAIVDYTVGRYKLNKWDWFKRHKSSKTYQRTENFYKRYGTWSMLGVGVPAVGKYIPPIAGIMKLPWIKFLPLYIVGKILYFIPLFFVLVLLGYL